MTRSGYDALGQSSTSRRVLRRYSHWHRSRLFYTGRQRSADDVLGQQRAAIRDGATIEMLKNLTGLAHELRERLGAGDIDGFGPLLHQSWELKRGLAGGISDESIDELYGRALDAGATGGKILGAGAGGFLLLFVSPERQPSVRTALTTLREVPLRFSARGTHISVWDGTSG
jgi:D-glycero-alpha-D-manno-heptose-7-phosphate kinase